MNCRFLRNARGITLIELMIAFVIFALVSGASYRLFVTQGRAYAVQDQVGEIQQNVRAGMETLIRDIRMTGFDSDRRTSQITINNPLIPGIEAITVSYEHNDTTQYTVAYWRDAPTSTVFRRSTATRPDGSVISDLQGVLLDNVDAFSLSYALDGTFGNEDGMVHEWQSDPTKIGSRRILAVQVQLTVRPDPAKPDIQKVVSSRRLESIIALRNILVLPPNT